MNLVIEIVSIPDRVLGIFRPDRDRADVLNSAGFNP